MYVHLLNQKRQTGKTTVLVGAAASLNAPLVCANFGQAKDVANQFDIKTVCMDDEKAFVANHPVFIMDHYAVERMILRYEEKLNDMSGELLRVRGINKRLTRLFRQGLQIMMEEDL